MPLFKMMDHLELHDDISFIIELIRFHLQDSNLFPRDKVEFSPVLYPSSSCFYPERAPSHSLSSCSAAHPAHPGPSSQGYIYC